MSPVAVERELIHAQCMTWMLIMLGIGALLGFGALYDRRHRGQLRNEFTSDQDRRDYLCEKAACDSATVAFDGRGLRRWPATVMGARFLPYGKIYR